MADSEEGCSGSYSEEKSFDEEEYKQQYIKAFEKDGYTIENISVCRDTDEVEIETTDGWNWNFGIITGVGGRTHHNDDIPERYKDFDDYNPFCVIL
ncbi:hypothetical protein Klosneuvirus_1_145 [Klosneuvirus KNV1]|uniref:Uncharacterized protein n=1 Tax=Klosneuvirus KNV1 TaxID=1977640 RepID=A0A1V0SI31_9VIRU|nr:hypothetical protein Klosneuvirus_1_145 [Klosneuvirus KNV1]